MRTAPFLVFLIGAVTACSGADSATGSGKDASSRADVQGFEPEDATLLAGADTTPNDGAPDVSTTADLGAIGTEDVPASPLDTHVAGEDVAKPADGTPEIAVDPASYTFSYVSPLPAPLVRQISIYNTGTASLTLTSVGLVPGASPDFIISAVPPLPKVLHPGDSTLALVVFQEVAGGKATLRIASDDPNHPTVDVALASFLKADLNGPDPCGGLQPTTLNFGSVKRGDTKTLTATVSNCSKDAPLVVKSITRGSQFFIPLTQEMQLAPAPALPVTLPPGGTLPLAVAYTPDLAGLDSGFFEIQTDDPAEPKLKLDLAGFGTEPPPDEIGLTIKLTWNSDLCDVDSHLIEPGGSFFDCKTDCYFGDPSPDWGVAGQWKDNPYLDVDDVDGFGPEHTNITEPVPGTYRFVVHYYDDSYEGSFGTDTDATVEVLSYGQVLATFGPVHLDVTNRTWDVFEVAWPSLQITPLGATYMATTVGGFCGFFP